MDSNPGIWNARRRVYGSDTPAKGIGLAYMVGPTGGYLLGFVVAALVTGFFAERGFTRSVIGALATMFAGAATILAFGFAWLAVLIGAEKALAFGVLPFLLGDQLVARVDLKADRQAGVLRVQAVHGEEGVERPLVVAALADELRLMGDWLELPDVAVADRGDLAGELSRVVAASRPAGGARPAG